MLPDNVAIGISIGLLLSPVIGKALDENGKD